MTTPKERVALASRDGHSARASGGVLLIRSHSTGEAIYRQYTDCECGHHAVGFDADPTIALAKNVIDRQRHLGQKWTLDEAKSYLAAL